MHAGISFQQTFCSGTDCIPICESGHAGLVLRSLLLTVQNSLDNVVARLPLTQGCPPLLINSTTGHYNRICMHSTSLWSAFLASVQKGRALERAFVALGTHCHAYQKYTGSLRNPDASQIIRTRSGKLMSAIVRLARQRCVVA